MRSGFKCTRRAPRTTPAQHQGRNRLKFPRTSKHVAGIFYWYNLLIEFPEPNSIDMSSYII